MENSFCEYDDNPCFVGEIAKTLHRLLVTIQKAKYPARVIFCYPIFFNDELFGNVRILNVSEVLPIIEVCLTTSDNRLFCSTIIYKRFDKILSNKEERKEFVRSLLKRKSNKEEVWNTQVQEEEDMELMYDEIDAQLAEDD